MLIVPLPLEEGIYSKKIVRKQWYEGKGSRENICPRLYKGTRFMGWAAHADYYMAESFRRLSEGKEIQRHDIILLKHEWLELSLMKRYGCDYDTAHAITARKYNYSAELAKWRLENE